MPDRHTRRDDAERDYRPAPPRPYGEPQPPTPSPDHESDPAHHGGLRDNTGSDKKPRVYTPWLLLRYNATDNGLGRPIPANTVFWVSPDIWVESSDPLGNPVLGQQNIVHARVFNLGKAQSSPTRVDFYWGDASLGLGPGHMNFIASDTVVVPYHRSKDVRVKWVPISTGHECLIVNTTCDINDVIAQPLQPTLDRHVGQRNVNVVQAGPGKLVPFLVGLNNLAPMMATITVAARLEHLAVSRKASATMSHRDIVSHVANYVRGEHTDIVRDVADESRFGRSAPRIRGQLSERSSIVPSREGKSFFAHMLLASDQRAASGSRVDTSRDIPLAEVVMKGFEHRELELELGVPGNAGPGEFVVFHVIQDVAGLQVGGYTIVVEIPGTRGDG
jgi:hypothetical protein